MSASPVARFPITIDGETSEIGTANELAIVLDVLQGQHDRQVLEQLRPHLAAIVATPQGLITTVKSLEPANQIFLVEALGDRLSQALRRSTYLAELLAALATAEVEDAILGTLGRAGLRALVLTAEDLANILQWVYGHSDQKVLDLLGAEYVRAIIRSGNDLGRILPALEAEAQQALLAQLGAAHVAALVRSGRELAFVLRAIPPVETDRLLARYSRPELMALIGNADDWAYLWARLEPDEQTAIKTKLGVD
jgi:hypothetical protein